MNRHSRLLDRIDFLTRQQVILEEVFGEDWFRNADETDKKHPAYIGWELCQTLVEQGSVIIPGQFYQLARMALDTYPFLELTRGSTEDLYIGLFDSIGDATVRRLIRSAIKKPDSYEDMRVQLYVAAWYSANHQVVKMVEIDEVRWPDIRVDLDIPNIPMLIECKHLRRVERKASEKLKAKIHHIVSNANKQIKAGKKPILHEQSVRHEHCHGVLVLDVSDVIPADGAEIDGVPAKVLEIGNFVQHELSGEKHRSVHTAVIVWDTFELEINPLVDYKSCLCSRRTLRINHTEPLTIFPGDKSAEINQVFSILIQQAIFSGYTFQLIAAQDEASSS